MLASWYNAIFTPHIPKPVRLPVELYRPIISNIHERGILYTLLFVSGVFFAEAERVLYHTIELDDHIRLLALSRCISNSERRARMIRKLVFSVNNGKLMTYYYTPSDLWLYHIGRILHARVDNLKFLQIRCNPSTECYWNAHALSRVFHGQKIRFQLQVLIIPELPQIYFQLRGFLETQSSITDLELRRVEISDWPLLSHTSLPLLTTLNLERGLTSYIPWLRPGLTHLKIGETRQRFLSSLVNCQDLQVLVLNMHPPSDLGEYVPCLRFLQCNINPRNDTNIVEIIQRVKCLAKLRSNTCWPEISEDDAISWATKAIKLSHSLELVTMVLCPPALNMEYHSDGSVQFGVVLTAEDWKLE